MENLLPEAIAIDILSRLPAESLLQSKRVCKTWRNLIRSTDFAYTRLRRQFQQEQPQYHYHGQDDDLCNKAVSSSRNCGGGTNEVSFLMLARPSRSGRYNESIYYGEYDYDKRRYYHKILKKFRFNEDLSVTVESFNPKAIVGSCNGLICFSVCYDKYNIGGDPIYILNPITGEEVILPKLINNNVHRDYQVLKLSLGFGYVHSTNEYKVVRITYRHYGKCDMVVQVYTLGGHSASRSWWWRSVTKNYHYFTPTSFISVHLDGVLHWLDARELVRILAFDLAHEEFIDVPSPPCFGSRKDRSFHLQVLEGCLCVVTKGLGEQMDIWLLKRKNSREGTNAPDYKCSSWSLEYSITLECMLFFNIPFALLNNGELLFCNEIQHLCVYDPKTATLKKVTDSLNVSRAIPHVNSLACFA